MKHAPIKNDDVQIYGKGKKAEHTPTPWKVGSVKIGRQTVFYIANNEEENVIDRGSVYGNDAAFIVRACNRDHLFNQLVNSLVDSHDTDICESDDCDTCNLIEEALKLAEES